MTRLFKEKSPDLVVVPYLDILTYLFFDSSEPISNTNRKNINFIFGDVSDWYSQNSVRFMKWVKIMTFKRQVN